MKLIPWLTLFTVAVCWILFAPVPFGDSVFQSLTLRQGANFIVQGLVTGHFMHTDGNHIFWNMTTLAIMGWVVEQRSRRLWVATVFAGIVVIDI